MNTNKSYILRKYLGDIFLHKKMRHEVYPTNIHNCLQNKTVEIYEIYGIIAVKIAEKRYPVLIES
jgi:hypothetical protein